MSYATLSPLEQRVYNACEGARGNLASIGVIESLKLSDDNTIRVVVSRLCKKKWFKRVKNGLYFVQTPFSSGLEDEFAYGQNVYNGYLGFSTALYLHKLSDQLPFEITVVTRSKSAVKKEGEYSFRSVAMGRKAFGSQTLGTGMGSGGRGNYVVSTRAKTLYDCLLHPDLAGGLPLVLKAFFDARLSEKEWREFFWFAQKFEKNAFYQRLGYLLSLLPEKDGFVEKAVLECGKKIKAKAYLQGRKKGEYNKEWMVFDNVGRKKLLGWWY
ncbi:hypothetical protein HY993_04205 [Candidatus Micrarchaeota archaeon]|nr:hypothetical protein [Candidatus Micrarchaeota archaeon]